MMAREWWRMTRRENRCFVFCANVSLMALLVCGCDSKSKNAATASTNNPAALQKVQTFQVKGVIKELKSDGKTVVIRHQEVPGYMPAMVMPFEDKNPMELKDLKVGDKITFRLSATEDDSWVDQVKKDEGTAPTVISTTTNLNGFTFVKDPEPLNVGDPLPDYHFTNEQDRAVSLGALKGQALAVTFIFTRCPLPNYCPRMSSNFKDTQELMLDPQGQHGTNWHLLTITFDPEFDTPAILKEYAARFKADPSHWNFLTGDFSQVSAIAEKFGELFWKDQGALNHNLRTAVIDSSGKVQRIFEGNNWTSEELAAELDKGMRL